MRIRELQYPEQVSGREVVRILHTGEPDSDVDEKRVVLIDTGLDGNEDPITGWGLLIADLAQYVAASLRDGFRNAETGAVPEQQEVLMSIMHVVLAELSDPSDEVRRLTDA